MYYTGENSSLSIPKHTLLCSRKAWGNYLSLDRQAENACNSNHN